jgi:transposase
MEEAVSKERSQTIGAAVRWCRREVGVKVSYNKLYNWFRRWGYRKKVPRPMVAKADVQAQEGWRKEGCWKLCRRRG